MEVGNQTKVTRDDWISRFFGYLGSLEYVYKKNETTSPREWNTDSVGDNIVYIYGVPKGGKTHYRKQLSLEFKEDEEYMCCGFDFGAIDDGLTELHFQLELSQAFAAAGFKFPCLELAARGDYNWAATVLGVASGSIENAKKVISLNPIEMVQGAKGIWDDVAAGIEYLKNTSPEEKEELKTLKNIIADKKKTGAIVELIDNRDPYRFFQISLATNAKNYEKNIVCLVDRFDLCQRKVGDTEAILKLMHSVPNIIWVLFSDKNPNEHITKYVPECNRWRMGGMNIEHTRRYLKEKCPGMVREWYDMVYENTGGYFGLLDLCIEAQSKEETMCQFPDVWVKPSANPRKSPTVLPTYSDSAKELIEEWLRCVWNGGPWSDDDEDVERREHPLKFLFEQEYQRVRGNIDGQAKDTFLPCLCYLVERSKTNLGTIKQFSWVKGNHIPGLIPAGSDCVREIEVNTPFCIEFVEYPQVLYLDPVIVKILSEFDYYGVWLEYFKERYEAKEKEVDGADAEAKYESRKQEKGAQNIDVMSLDRENSDFSVAFRSAKDAAEFVKFFTGASFDKGVGLDTKAETKPTKEEDKPDTDGTQPPQASGVSKNQLTRNSADKEDHDKDVDLPSDYISEVVVQSNDDNEGEEKLSVDNANNVPGTKPPDKD